MVMNSILARRISRSRTWLTGSLPKANAARFSISTSTWKKKAACSACDSRVEKTSRSSSGPSSKSRRPKITSSKNELRHKYVLLWPRPLECFGMVKRAPVKRRPRKAKPGTKGLAPGESILDKLDGPAADAAAVVEKVG